MLATDITFAKLGREPSAAAATHLRQLYDYLGISNSPMQFCLSMVRLCQPTLGIIYEQDIARVSH